MLPNRLPINYSWIQRLLFMMACLILATSSCKTLVVPSTNTLASSTQTSQPFTASPAILPSLTSLPPTITNGTLAYLTWPVGDEKGRIRLINVANRETQEVKFDCFLCNTFSFSLDGTHVVITGAMEFSAHIVDEIMLLDFESGEITKIAKDLLPCKNNASWSPDGKYLLYINTYDCTKLKSEIEVMDLETNETRQLTNTKGLEYGPTWSPDGKYIAYGYRDMVSGGIQGADVYSREPDGYLWLMDSDGNNPNQISDLPTGFQFQISWSPDSTNIVFSSPMECADIYIIDITTNKTNKFFDVDGCATNPVWSSDGKSIAILVTTKDPTTNQTLDWQIYLVSADGNDVISLVHSRQGEEPPLYLGWAQGNSLDLNTTSP